MSGDSEFGTCDICKKESHIQRTYFRYDIKCECHSPNHFELVYHCNECVPTEPDQTKLTIKTNNLTKL